MASQSQCAFDRSLPVPYDFCSYAVMLDCWRSEADRRPSFEKILSSLGRLSRKYPPAQLQSLVLEQQNIAAQAHNSANMQPKRLRFSALKSNFSDNCRACELYVLFVKSPFLNFCAQHTAQSFGCQWLCNTVIYIMFWPAIYCYFSISPSVSPPPIFIIGSKFSALLRMLINADITSAIFINNQTL